MNLGIHFSHLAGYTGAIISAVGSLGFLCLRPPGLVWFAVFAAPMTLFMVRTIRLKHHLSQDQEASSAFRAMLTAFRERQATGASRRRASAGSCFGPCRIYNKSRMTDFCSLAAGLPPKSSYLCGTAALLTCPPACRWLGLPMRNTRFMSTLASSGSSTASGPGGCFRPYCDVSEKLRARAEACRAA